MTNLCGRARSVAPPFSWKEVWAAAPEIIHDGRWGNSTVLRVRLAGRIWAIKSYCKSPWIYRKTFGRFWANREYQVISALEGIIGIPCRPCLLDDGSFCCGYEEGRTLLDIRTNPVPVEKSFFLALEGAVRAMHERGVCHLDLRNGRNILMLRDGSPLLLDFQSCVSLRWLPSHVRRVMTDIDLSGVYKWWNRLSHETMDQTRFEVYQRLNRKRVLWPFKGYGSWLRMWRSEPLRRPGKKDERY